MTDQNISNPEQVSADTSREDFMTSFETEPGVLQPKEGSTTQQQSIEIDEQFKSLPTEEAIKRTEQSRYDKLYTDHEKLRLQYEERSKIEGFLNDLLEDDETLDAFLAERKPELLQKKDITSSIQEKLKAEFGDFKPSRSEADDDPGGKAWVYFKRLDVLYAELSGKGTPKVQTLKELKAERELRKQTEQKQLESQIGELKTDMNWDDATVQRFYDWSQKLSIKDLGKMFRWALANPKRLPSLSGTPGEQTQQTARNRFLSTL